MSTSSRQTNAIYFPQQFCWNCWKRSSFSWDCCQDGRSLELPTGLSWTTPVRKKPAQRKQGREGEGGETDQFWWGLWALDQYVQGWMRCQMSQKLIHSCSLYHTEANSSHMPLPIWEGLRLLPHCTYGSSWAPCTAPCSGHSFLGFSCWSQPVPKPQLSQGPGLSQNSALCTCDSPRQPHSASFWLQKLPHLHCLQQGSITQLLKNKHESCTISNKFSHPINYLASTCLYKRNLVGKGWGRAWKSGAAENSRGAEWPSTRTGSNGVAERPGDMRGLAGALCGALGKSCHPLSGRLCFEIHEQDTQGKRKHIYFKHMAITFAG